MLAVALTAILLAPGALLISPLRDAFANVMVEGEKTVAMPDLRPITGDGRVHRTGTGLRQSTEFAAGGGRAARALPAPRAAREGLFKLADFQTDGLGASQDLESTLIGDDGGDELMSKRQHQAVIEETSPSFAIGGGSLGGGFGGGMGGGAPLAGSPGASGLGQSTPEPDPLTDKLAQLGDKAGAPSAAPEPAVWVNLILGFGLTGAMLRKRRGLV